MDIKKMVFAGPNQRSANIVSQRLSFHITLYNEPTE